jgi:glycosyltransferase involved in cell wall biosynthesis
MSVLVSILVPTYNQEKYILETLQGIDQQHIDFPCEVLIGDDSSTDQTGDLCRSFSFSNRNIRVKYFQHTSNKGVLGNWQFLVSQASGQYFAVCEGDDYWTDPTKLSTQVAILEADQELAICFHRTRYFHSNNKETIYVSPQIEVLSRTTINELALGNYIDNLSVVCRNYSIKGQYPQWVFAQDLPVPDYVWHMYNAQFGEIFFVDKVMADYRVRHDSVWSSIDKEQQAVSIVEKLIRHLKLHINKTLVQENLSKQAMTILFEFKRHYPHSSDERIVESVLNVVEPRFLYSFMAQKYKEQQLQNRHLISSFSFKLGQLLNYPKRFFFREK